MSKRLPLNSLDPSALKRNKVIAFIGRRDSGKSHLMESIVYYYRHIPNCVVFSSTEGGNQAWGKHVPKSFIFTLYTAERMNLIYERQRRARRRAELDPNYVPPQVLVILEDQMFDDKIGSDKVLTKILMIGRHFGMTICITMQYTKSMKPALREQVDYVFCLQHKNAVMRKRLYDDWFGVFPDFQTFESTLIQCTEFYGTLMVDQTARTSRIQDNVFYYRAPAEIPIYKVGDARYWYYHYIYYKGDAVQEEDAQDDTDVLVDEATSRRHSSRVQVVKRPPASRRKSDHYYLKGSGSR